MLRVSVSKTRLNGTEVTEVCARAGETLTMADRVSDLMGSLADKVADNFQAATTLSLDELRELAADLVSRESASSSTPDGSMQPDTSAPKRFRVAAQTTAQVATPTTSTMFSSTSATTRSSAVGHASLASQVQSFIPSMSARSRDELDSVLGMRDAVRVRAILEVDRARISANKPSPLSRGYRGVREPVPPLSERRAAELSREAVERAAKSRHVPPADVDRLSAAAGSPEMGKLFLQELERSIASRLSSDTAFDPAKFPAAATRFAGY